MAVTRELCSSLEVLLFLLIVGYGSGKSFTKENSQLKCISLKAECMNDVNCYTNAINVNWFCQTLFYGKGEECSQVCKEELGNFTSKDTIGRALATCSCGDDALCLTYRARGLKCLQDGYGKNKTGCSDMLYRCKQDEGCLKLWERFLLRCTHLISGTQCTDKCLDVQKSLYKHRLLQGYQECECNGHVEEEAFCRGVRAHHEELCAPRIKNAVNELPNTVDVGTNLQRLANGDRDHSHGVTIRSCNTICYFVLTAIITLTIQLI